MTNKQVKALAVELNIKGRRNVRASDLRWKVARKLANWRMLGTTAQRLRAVEIGSVY